MFSAGGWRDGWAQFQSRNLGDPAAMQGYCLCTKKKTWMKCVNFCRRPCVCPECFTRKRSLLKKKKRERENDAMRERETPLEEIQTLSNGADESRRDHGERRGSGRGNVTWPGWSEEIMLIKGKTSPVPTRRGRTSPWILTCRNPSSTFLALEPCLGTGRAKQFFLLKMQGSIKAVVSKLYLNSRPGSQPSLEHKTEHCIKTNERKRKFDV